MKSSLINVDWISSRRQQSLAISRRFAMFLRKMSANNNEKKMKRTFCFWEQNNKNLFDESSLAVFIKKKVNQNCSKVKGENLSNRLVKNRVSFNENQ